jgi:phytanoyl-CoA dioxygenase PhyH
MEPFLDSTALVGDPDALNKRLEAEGYLFIRGLLPRDAVLGVRRQCREVAAAGGWLDRAHPLDEGVAEPAAACTDPEPRYIEVFRRLYVLEALHALKHHPAIVGFFERLFGEPVLVHPLFVMRNIFPQRPESTTPAHQDYVHIQGTPRTYTTWIPLSDTPLDQGCLTVAAGSHRDGVRDFRVTNGSGGLEVVDRLAGRWRASPFGAGDVLMFHSMTVHKGLPNLTNRLRQSMDARYQRVSEPVSELSLQPYANLYTWDQVYAGWRSTELQYYWRKQPITIGAFDAQYYDKRDVIAFEMAERGDTAARASLLRIVQRDKSPAKRERAAALLAALDGGERTA